MDTAIYILAKVLIVLAAIGIIGCCMVIPATAASILRVAFQKDTETELAQRTTKSVAPKS
jgi:hypothetical protein